MVSNLAFRLKTKIRRLSLSSHTLIFLSVLLFLLISISNLNKLPSTDVIPSSTSTEEEEPLLPLIVFCTGYYQVQLLTPLITNAINSCPYKCRISDDYSMYPEADVAIFHARDTYMNWNLHLHSKPSRLNIFYSMEVPPHERIRKRKVPKNFFNVTMTFRTDSTIWKPYDRFEEIQPHERGDPELVWTEEQIETALEKKTKFAVQFVSHCHTHSLREKYTEKMQKYANISLYGICHQNGILDTDKEENRAIEEHFFYLAFENAVCKDYVTEKFWRLKKLIVPIVLKRSLVSRFAKDKYFIAADDFDSPKALVEHLVYLSQNMTEYKRYLEWTKIYKKTFVNDEREFCEICEMAVKKERHEIADLYDWWENKAQCQFNYFNHSLRDNTLINDKKKSIYLS